MNLVLKAAYAIVPLLALVVGALIVKLIQNYGGVVVLLFSKNRRLQPLTPAVQVAEDAAVAAISVAEQDVVARKPVLTLVRDSGMAAEGVLVENKSVILDAVEGEVHVLVSGPPSLEIVTSGGGVAVLPDLSK